MGAGMGVPGGYVLKGESTIELSIINNQGEDGRAQQARPVPGRF